MNNADLAEIRALLQASAPPERRPRGPLLGAIRSLLPPIAAESRPVMPPPRRVGLRTADAADVEAVEELLLSRPIDPDGSAAALEARRHAFGQRHGTAAGFAPVLRLAAPLPPAPAPDDPEVGEILRRSSLRLARLAAPADDAHHALEPPYHPDDMTDGGEAEQIYADSGLFEPHPPIPACVAGTGNDDPQRQLLRHLERIFVAELAALSARGIGR